MYRRVLLKLSGEALLGEHEYGVDPKVSTRIANEIKEITDLGIEVAVVIGGGNIFRGYTAAIEGMDRATADYMGMLATAMNGLALMQALEKIDVPSRVQSALAMPGIAEPYIRRRAIRHLEKGRVIIFVAGTGNPYFTTDMAAALRACEIKCDCVLKATNVDGVYDSDPKKNQNAKMFSKLSYLEVLSKELNVMDHSAITLCKDNKVPIVVFNLNIHDNIKRVVNGEKVGTVVS